MVGGKKHYPAHFNGAVSHSAHAVIDSLDRFDGSLEYAGVSYHIAVCEIEYNNIVFSAFNRFAYLVAYLVRAHFRLKVIGRDLRGIDKYPVFSLKRNLSAAVKEEGYMRVFLGFRDTKLRKSVFGKILAERIFKRLRLESYFNIRH